MSDPDPNLPRGSLAGVRVLDLSRVLAGPLCTMVLGDLGAHVIKVERPGTGDDTRSWGPPWADGPDGREAAYYLCVNRNKRSVAADLKAEDGRALVRRLARDADVVVENFAPGMLDGWGLGYADLSRENPGLVFCSITGSGEGSESERRPGYDFAIQGDAITADPLTVAKINGYGRPATTWPAQDGTSMVTADPFPVRRRAASRRVRSRGLRSCRRTEHRSRPRRAPTMESPSSSFMAILPARFTLVKSDKALRRTSPVEVANTI